MTTAAAAEIMKESPSIEELAQMLQQLVDRKSYALTDILTVDELAAAAKVSRTTIFKVLPKLPVSYGLGDSLPRVIWGDFLEYLRQTRID